MTAPLSVALHDIRRATLPLHCGNEGWIGVSPTGDAYHVVVPVDRQIARGVMACNRPTDGTPFGGYINWLYFCCQPYELTGDEENESEIRERQAQDNARRFLAWLASYGFSGVLVDTAITASEDVGNTSSDPTSVGCPAPKSLVCRQCGKNWETVAGLLRDGTVILERYRVDLDTFLQGRYVFRHSCGGEVEVPVLRLARRPARGRLLIGSQACPGMCYHETSLRPCAAECEGSRFRRLAWKLRSRKSTG